MYLDFFEKFAESNDFVYAHCTYARLYVNNKHRCNVEDKKNQCLF